MKNDSYFIHIPFPNSAPTCGPCPTKKKKPLKWIFLPLASPFDALCDIGCAALDAGAHVRHSVPERLPKPARGGRDGIAEPAAQSAGHGADGVGDGPERVTDRRRGRLGRRGDAGVLPAVHWYGRKGGSEW